MNQEYTPGVIAKAHEAFRSNIVRIGVGAAAGSLMLSACGASPENAVDTGTTVVATVDTLAFDGNVTDGSDATIRLEDDQGLYDCGGVKGESWKNEDGTDKPFNPNNIIDHMNAHPELASSDYAFWTGVFGEEGFNFLADKGIANSQYQDGLTVDAEVPETYTNFLAKQNGATLKVDAVSENYACKDAAGNYRVFPVNAKQLVAGETRLTGIALSELDYMAFIGVMQAQGKDLSRVFIQEMYPDTDGDGESDEKVFMVFNKHQMCANNELRIQVSVTEQTTVVDTVTPATGGPRVTVTTTRGVTSTTPNTPTTKDPNLDYNNNDGPNNGPGSGGQPGPEGVVSTTTPPETMPNTTTTRLGNSTTTAVPVPSTVTPTTIAG